MMAGPAVAGTIKHFRKTSSQSQSVSVTGAISMLAYSYAANDVPRARCVANWYFGQKAPDGSIVAGPGPSELTDELSVAELVDSSQNVEAVILRLADKACGRPPSPILPKRQKQAPEQQWLKMNNGRRVYFTSDGQR